MSGYDRFRNEFPGDFEAPMIDHSMPGLVAPREPLELKDQHLVALAHKNGFLMGRNSVLENANSRLEAKVAELEKHNKQLLDENQRYELSETESRAGYKSGQQLVDEIEEALTKKRNAK